MAEPGGRASSSPLLGGGPEPTLAELSSTGRRAWSFPELDVPVETLDIDERRDEPVRLVEVAEHDMVMHFTRLAHRNFAVDLGAYPLGSCTMKYNPKVADWTVALFADLHPDAPTSAAQGALEVLVEAERMLCELTGMY
ncbi:MAG: aminomethyl-transferring glycine dehydrogenase subunit GcvPB, partial [Acidimicrobiia bacterium]